MYARRSGDLMGMPRFELGSRSPKPRMLTRLHHIPTAISASKCVFKDSQKRLLLLLCRLLFFLSRFWLGSCSRCSRSSNSRRRRSDGSSRCSRSSNSRRRRSDGSFSSFLCNLGGLGSLSFSFLLTLDNGKCLHES